MTTGQPDQHDDAPLRPSVDEVSRWWESALQREPALADERSVVFHDLARQARRFELLRQAFPADTLHAVAIKANPVVDVLRPLVAAGAGLEAASIEEVSIALAAGCPADRVVFDSPAKTPDELRFALERGMTVNVDNRDELAAALRVDRHPASRIGVRVKPGRSDGRIAATSVGGPGSRFGFDPPELLELLRDLPDEVTIDGLHVHVGSQGCRMEQLVDAVRFVDELRSDVESIRSQPVTFIDIGGGLPTDYGSEETAPSFSDYANALGGAAPDLWRRGGIVTEFGRALLAGCGVAVSRVEYVKRTTSGRQVAVIHLGADFLLRAAYAPQNWPYRFSVLRPRSDATTEWDVAGPLCFAGDVIGHGVQLHEPLPGDRIAIHDAGAYSLSMWSRHCSRGMPMVIGIDGQGGQVVLLEPERPEDLATFWSRGTGRALGSA